LRRRFGSLRTTVHERQGSTLTMRPRILAVWTRDLDGTESIGRVNTARAVRDAMAAHGRPTHLRLYNLLERPRPGRLAAAAWALLLGLLRGRPLPLQCALFTPGPEARIAARGAAECTVLYADGIRP